MNSQYKELTDKAFQYHQEGNHSKAEQIYKALLEINPDDANILNLLGLLKIAEEDYDSAIDYLTKSFIISKSGAVASNLAKAYYSIEQTEKAVKLYLEALKTEPTDDIYYSLGLAYKKLDNLEASIEAYHNALDENPGNYSACFNLALAYSDIGDIQNAISYAKKCEILNDKDETLFGVLSGFYEQTGDYGKAINSLKKAAELNPDNFLYYYNMAVLHSMLNNDTEAIDCYLKSITINPNYVEAYVNLANLVKKRDAKKAVELLKTAYKMNQKEENVLLSLAQLYKNMFMHNESIKHLKELLLINPSCDEAYSLMAMNYMDMCEYETALKNYDIAVKLNPENLNFQHGRAIALKYLGQRDECKQILESIVNNPLSSTETKVALGMMYLQDKDFEKGMQLYRLRSMSTKLNKVNRDNIWTPGDSIDNKTVLVYSDCGLGDSIMCARYLPELESKAKSVIVQTDKELVSILQESFQMVNVIRKSLKPPKHDVLLPFMDIMLALGMDFSNIPDENLIANNALIEMFSKLPVFNTNKKKIGLFWQGNRKIFKNRTIKFDIINKLTENKKLNFYSFQFDMKIKETDNLFDLSPHIKDYADTAALLKNIDVMVTIDSSVAHMAGALGVKTFLLLPKIAEWRWFYDETTTPWYKSVTIFKQKNSGDWDEVIDRVAKAL